MTWLGCGGEIGTSSAYGRLVGMTAFGLRRVARDDTEGTLEQWGDRRAHRARAGLKT